MPLRVSGLSGTRDRAEVLVMAGTEYEGSPLRFLLARKDAAWVLLDVVVVDIQLRLVAETFRPTMQALMARKRSGQGAQQAPSYYLRIVGLLAAARKLRDLAGGGPHHLGSEERQIVLRRAQVVVSVDQAHRTGRAVEAQPVQGEQRPRRRGELFRLPCDLRLELLDLLAQAPRSVEELARASGQSAANASQHLQALHAVKPVMFALVSANLINILANWALIYGHLGLPAMGPVGAAWATLVSRVYMAVVLAGAFLLAQVACIRPSVVTIPKGDVVLAVATHAWRLLVAVGSYWPVVGLPSPSHLPQYVLLFTVGAMSYRRGWLGAHISGQGPDGVFLVTASHDASNGWGAIEGEIYLQYTNGQVLRLAHHRSTEDGYWVQPRASISRDGRYVVFASDWGRNTGGLGDPYIIDLGITTPPPPPPVNHAPVLVAISNKEVRQGDLLTFTVTASDTDIPRNTLRYSLDPGAPAGATIDAQTGVH